MGVIDEVWYGGGIVATAARAVLAPASWMYGNVVSWRNRQYQDGSGRALPSAIPALSIGNLSVGGTGKTPVSAWAARELAQRGGHPAIVMRGYGSDEPLVHKRLNEHVPVILDADRVRGAKRAQSAGADCVVLDDAFQHRRIERVSDWVLLATERFRMSQRVLPAGPLRERPDSLARASVLVVTRKSSSFDEARRVGRVLERNFPSAPVVFCHLALGELTEIRTGVILPLDWLRGRRIAAAAAVGVPAAFFAQLRQRGAEVLELEFRDHHAFSASDIARLVDAADRTEGLVCTLKDAVKLGPLWPAAAAPLWYVSQVAVIEEGYSVLDHEFEKVLAARQATH